MVTLVCIWIMDCAFKQSPLEQVWYLSHTDGGHFHICLKSDLCTDSLFGCILCQNSVCILVHVFLFASWMSFNYFFKMSKTFLHVLSLYAQLLIQNNFIKESEQEDNVMFSVCAQILANKCCQISRLKLQKFSSSFPDTMTSFTVADVGHVFRVHKVYLEQRASNLIHSRNKLISLLRSVALPQNLNDTKIKPEGHFHKLAVGETSSGCCAVAL